MVKKLKNNPDSPKKGKHSFSKKKNLDILNSKEATIILDDEKVKNTLLDDTEWQCTVVMLVFSSENLSDFLLKNMNELPENITVVTKTTMFSDSNAKRKEKKEQGTIKTKGRSSRSVSKSSKKSAKSKPFKESPKKKISKSSDDFEEASDWSNTSKMCLSFKRYILGLRNTDIEKETVKNNLDEDKKIEVKKMSEFEKDNSISSNKENILIENKIFHRYIMLWNFLDPLIPEEMSKLFVPVKAVINVTGNTLKNNSFLETQSDTTASTLKNKSKTKKIVKLSREKSIDRYALFLEEISKSLSVNSYLETLKDTIFLNYTMGDCFTYSETEHLEFKESILEKLYNIKEAWAKFEIYKDTIVIYDIPSDEKYQLRDASVYNTMISMVPLESTNVPVVLHCMLEQIAWWNNDIINIQAEQNSQTDINLSNSVYDVSSSNKTFYVKNTTPLLINIGNEIKLNTFHLNLPEFDFENISTEMFKTSPVHRLWERYPSHSFNTSKWYKFQTQRLKESNSAWKTFSYKLFSVCLHQFLISCLVSNANIILKNVNDNNGAASKEEVDKFTYFYNKEPDLDKNSFFFAKQIVLEIICRVSQMSLHQHNLANGQTQLQVLTESFDTQLPTVLDYSYKPQSNLSLNQCAQEEQANKGKKLSKLASFLFCSDIVSLYECSSYLNNTFYDAMKNYEFIEHLENSVMCQCLQKAFQKFCNVTYDYFAPTDSILLWFNNSTHSNLVSFSSTKGVLETPLGFRDFYKHKLKEKTNIDKTLKTLTVYNLSSLQMETTEMLVNFCSPDSSSVLVKRIKYFNSQTSNFSVSVKKNNLTLTYESLKKLMKLSINLHDQLTLNCIINWNLDPSFPTFTSKSSIGVTHSPKNSFEHEVFSFNSEISIYLPSGLLVEVVPLNSTLGPFYIRQTYLEKGPSCSGIWEEHYRCSFNNGTVIIFYRDGTVDVLYSNGTVLKCHSLEFITSEIVYNVKNSLSKNEYGGNDNTQRGSKIEKSKKKRKGSQTVKSNKKKLKKDVINPESMNEKTKIRKLDNNDATLFSNLDQKSIERDMEKASISSYVIKEHSILSWNGDYQHFKEMSNTETSRSLDLRMAFDNINQELFLQRNDGMTSLFTPQNFTVTFPNGTKTTAFTEDSKIFKLENEFVPEFETERDGFSDDLKNSQYLTGNNQHVTFNNDINLFDDSLSEHAENDYVLVETSYMIEHQNFAAVKYSSNGFEVQLLFPGNVVINVDKNGLFDLNLKENEKITLFHDKLNFEANVMSDTLNKSSTNIQFEDVENDPKTFCQTLDSFGNIFTVDERGNTNFLPNKYMSETNLQSSNLFHSRIPQNSGQFFVLKRDFTGYEMLQKIEHDNFILNDVSRRIIKHPVLSSNNEFHEIFIESEIHKTKSEVYLVDYVTSNTSTPSWIRRKDLLKLEKMPKIIWFDPRISSASKINNIEKTTQILKMPKAISFFHIVKLKQNPLNSNLFFKSLEKYVQKSQKIYQQYLQHNTQVVRKEDLVKKEENQKLLLGSFSYYLTDNLPFKFSECGNQETSNNDYKKESFIKIFTPSPPME